MNYIENIILWTFALYGAYDIIKMIIKIISTSRNLSKNAYMIIAVKDGERYIEGLLRKIIYENENEIKHVLVVDLNSHDDTKNIVRKLEKDNNYFRLVDWEECKNIMEAKI